MNPRVVLPAVAAAAATGFAARESALVAVGGVLVAWAALIGAQRDGTRGWVFALIPTALVLLAIGGRGAPGVVAAALAGRLAPWLVSRGWEPTKALAAAAVPYGAWSIGLALSGFDPIPVESRAAMMRMFEESASRGDVTAERLSEMRAGAETALEAVRRTWVASEVVWFWATVLVAWAVGRRYDREAAFAALGRFSRFDVPDWVVGVLIAGLALVLLPGVESWSAVRTVGWNLVVGTGFFWMIRGIAVQWARMESAGWRPPFRLLVLVAGAMLILPAFLLLTFSVGLFDTWFDFRGIKPRGAGGNRFSIRRDSREDDLPDRK